MPRVTVVIPNWNGLDHLPECMDALVSQTFRDFETIVVDNGSADGSVEWLESNCPGVTVMRRDDNGGFSAAVNLGIRSSQAEFVALLNNDTLAEPDWLAELVGALDEQPGYDIAASLMLFFDESDLVNAAGDVFRLRELRMINRGFREPALDFLVPHRVLGACAGAAIYRRTLFDEIGLFDESFFLMHEDTDFNMRALIQGKRCLYAPSARILHKHSASIKTIPSLEAHVLRERNAGLVIGKNLPVELLMLAPFIRLWTLTSQTVFMPRAAWKRARKVLGRVRRGARAWNEGLRTGLSRRGELWPDRKASRREIVRWLLDGSGPVD